MGADGEERIAESSPPPSNESLQASDDADPHLRGEVLRIGEAPAADVAQHQRGWYVRQMGAKRLGISRLLLN